MTEKSEKIKELELYAAFETAWDSIHWLYDALGRIALDKPELRERIVHDKVLLTGIRDDLVVWKPERKEQDK